MKVTKKMMDDIWAFWKSKKGSRGFYPKGRKLTRNQFTKIRLRMVVKYIVDSIEPRWNPYYE